MAELETVKTTREVKAIAVPFGNEILLPADTEVIILQALGGTYTVIAGGQTLRIAEVDADALGKTKPIQESIIDNPNLSLEDKVWAQLKTCYDPEIPVDIVDLGLIYGITVETLAQDVHKVIIKMTLTAPGCGMGPIIAAEAKQKVLMIPKVKEVEIEMVFDPPWDRSRLSETAKLVLGLL